MAAEALKNVTRECSTVGLITRAVIRQLKSAEYCSVSNPCAKANNVEKQVLLQVQVKGMTHLLLDAGGGASSEDRFLPSSIPKFTKDEASLGFSLLTAAS